jgi:hypothetical protein
MSQPIRTFPPVMPRPTRSGRRRTSAETIPAPMLTDAEVSAEMWARLNDSPHPTQAATVTPPDA